MEQRSLDGRCLGDECGGDRACGDDAFGTDVGQRRVSGQGQSRVDLGKYLAYDSGDAGSAGGGGGDTIGIRSPDQDGGCTESHGFEDVASRPDTAVEEHRDVAADSAGDCG